MKRSLCFSKEAHSSSHVDSDLAVFRALRDVRILQPRSSVPSENGYSVSLFLPSSGLEILIIRLGSSYLSLLLRLLLLCAGIVPPPHLCVNMGTIQGGIHTTLINSLLVAINLVTGQQLFCYNCNQCPSSLLNFNVNSSSFVILMMPAHAAWPSVFRFSSNILLIDVNRPPPPLRPTNFRPRPNQREGRGRGNKGKLDWNQHDSMRRMHVGRNS